jgi:hypothetical protein
VQGNILFFCTQDKKLSIKDMVDALLEDSVGRFARGEKVLWLSTDKIPEVWLSDNAKNQMVR